MRIGLGTHVAALPPSSSATTTTQQQQQQLQQLDSGSKAQQHNCYHTMIHTHNDAYTSQYQVDVQQLATLIVTSG
jgi:hypothetical protein